MDGVRGLLALLVLLHHVSAFAAPPGVVMGFSVEMARVPAFFALSGFVLYLPAAHRDRIEMSRPFAEFVRRRARRLLVPWYASLVLCVLVGGFFFWAGYQPPFQFLPQNVLDVVTHATLTHSLTRYSGSINGPGYTLGTEWQLSLMMVGFLWFARRCGWTVLLLTGLALSLPYTGTFGWTLRHLFHPAFALPFLIGMASARLARRPEWLLLNRFDARFRSPFLAGAAALSLMTFPFMSTRYFNSACWMIGIATGCACILMTWHPRQWVTRLVSCGPLRSVGAFSYSLYLVHFPLLALLQYAAQAYSIPESQRFLYVFLPALPVVLLCAYLFHRVFERPFLHSRKRMAAKGDERDPAPRVSLKGRFRVAWQNALGRAATR